MTDPKSSFNNWIEAEMKKNFKLSEPFVFTSSSLLTYKFIALTSLFQIRRIVKRQKDYHLSYSPADWNVVKNFDPWQLELQYSTDFKEQTFEKEIDGTEKVIECNSCSGAGKKTCTNCKGKKELKCSSCHGSCQIKCSSCSGRGEKTCDNCYGRPASKHECTRCGGRGIISCSNCRNGYYTCSTCAGRGMVRCETCNGNGEIICNNCNGKGRLIEFNVLTAKNFVSVEHFDILETGLKREHIEHFNPLTALEEKYTLIDINKETINIEEIPPLIFQLKPEKIKEIFEEHRNKSLDILKQTDCHKLEMMFGAVSIDDFYRIEYNYGGKNFEVIFFKDENHFFLPENPWKDFRENVESEIEQLYSSGNKKSTLGQINLYKNENISTIRIEAIKKEILNSFIKKDVLLFSIPYILASIILGLVFNVESENISTVFILTIIPFAWIIYKRNKLRKNKIPEVALNANILEDGNSNDSNKKLIIGIFATLAIFIAGLFLFEKYKTANAAEQANENKNNTQINPDNLQDNSIPSNQQQQQENSYPLLDTNTTVVVSDSLSHTNESTQEIINDKNYNTSETKPTINKKEETSDIPVEPKKIGLQKPNTETNVVQVSKTEGKNIKASFPGGEDAMKQFLKRNIVFPSNFVQDYASRRFKLMIMEDGTITSAKFLQWDSVDPLNNEGLRVISTMPKWTPELFEGKPVATETYITIEFSPKR